MVPAEMLTGLLKAAFFHPAVELLAKFTFASSLPFAVHSCPVCGPVFWADLKNRMASTTPSTLLENFIPSVTCEVSASAGFVGSVWSVQRL